LTPSEFFIVVLIYWKPASYRSSLDLSSFDKTKTGRLLSWLVFFFWTDKHAIRSVDNSTISS
jgi:hypothetical protein